MTENDSSLLRLDGVSKSYDSGSEEIQVLQDISLQVAAGDTLAIVGPSGSGKSTLLNLMGGLDSPSAGAVYFRDQRLDSMSEAELARFRNRQVGFVFQLHHLLPQCSVLENVLIPTLPAEGRTRQETVQRAKELLQRVGLGDRISHRPGQLSGGERQRTALVRALINQPGLLLADEPTGSLDRAASEKMVQLLKELNEENGVTLVMVTHAERLTAGFGRVLNLQDGALGSRGDTAPPPNSSEASAPGPGKNNGNG